MERILKYCDSFKAEAIDGGCNSVSPSLIIIAIIVFVVAFWVFHRLQQSPETPVKTSRIEKQQKSAQSLPPYLQAEIQTLLTQNKKIAAIKKVRKYTGLGLKEAKDYVEALSKSGATGAEIPLKVGITPELKTELKNLISNNRKIEAIKLLRNRSGLGLKQAKEYVDELDISS
jgi:ribosomal protein L7/L12